MSVFLVITLEKYIWEMWWVWIACTVLTSAMQKAVMTKIYVTNKVLAKKILRDREDKWKIRGFGWVTLRDMPVWYRLSKAIILRNDPDVSTQFIWFVYVLVFSVMIFGFIIYFIYIVMKIALIFF